MRLMLSLDTLKDFDYGKVDAAFRKELANAVRDLVDRPGEKKKREVVLQVELVPRVEQQGDVVEADVEFVVWSRIPKRRTATRPTAVTKQGQLVFNDLAPDNPNQATVDER